MLITKSNYMIGLQCPRYFWIAKHEKCKLPEPDANTQHIFNQGRLLEEYAHKIYPKGILIPSDSFKDNLEKTKELIKQRKIIFEAGILTNNLFSRADMLLPVEEDEWDLVEIKSSSKVKDEHIVDVAFQKYVYTKAGLKIRKCFLMHVNSEYERKGRIKPKKLLLKEDITERVDEEIKNVEPNLKDLFHILDLHKTPDFQLEDINNCSYSNPIIDEFMESLPEGSVFELHRGGKKCVELFGKQICLLNEIPEEYNLTGHQKTQKECAETGKPHIEKEKIKEFLDSLKYPLHYLDFETINTAVPLFDYTKPYQQIPFQYSLHIVESPGAEPKHVSFLVKEPKDGRKEFIESLKENIGDKGDVIVYNQSFEKRILIQLGELFSEKEWVDSILERIKDLLVPFQKFYYYNPKQKGKASIKAVLPAITGKDAYKELEIQNGNDANIQYLTATFGESSEKDIIYENLEKYCGLDTEAMIWIVDELEKITENKTKKEKKNFPA